MIRKLKKEERQLYFDLADEFYHSPAVLHPVPAENYKNTFDELMRSDVSVSYTHLRRRSGGGQRRRALRAKGDFAA